MLWKESVHRLRITFYFAELFDQLDGKGAFEMCHSLLYFLSFHMQMSCSLAYAVYASPQKLVRLLFSE